MSSLGFLTVYHLLNSHENVVCERAFLPDAKQTKAPLSLETGKNIRDADVAAFSVAFESDYPNMLTILDHAGIPLYTKDRNENHPLVIGGGISLSLNPEPVADFLDGVLVGEAEVFINDFLNILHAYYPDIKRNKAEIKKEMARAIPSAYIPEFFHISRDSQGKIKEFIPKMEGILLPERAVASDPSSFSTHSSIITPNAAFGETGLVEVSRGCFRGCRFCAAGFLTRPPRFRSLSGLGETIREMAEKTRRIGLLGAAVSDHPEIDGLLSSIDAEDLRISFSSLRADTLAQEGEGSGKMIRALVNSRAKTVAIAPDAGSQRMRNIINKNISRQQVMEAVENLVCSGIINIRLYFMVGLPWEKKEDILEIVEMTKAIQQVFVQNSRRTKKIGTLMVSLNPFIPKPVTPFQWERQAALSDTLEKITIIREGLQRVSNVRFQVEDPYGAVLQGLLSKGDRRVGELLAKSFSRMNRPKKLLPALENELNTCVFSPWEKDSILPWDIVSHGVKKQFLQEEHEKAGKELPGAKCKPGKCTICGVCKG